MPLHELADSLGPTRSRAPPVFHAFTGSDQTSFFGGRGKLTGWDTWKIYEDATEAFVSLSHARLQDVIIDTMPQIFIVLMYDRGSSSKAL